MNAGYKTLDSGVRGTPSTSSSGFEWHAKMTVSLLDAEALRRDIERASIPNETLLKLARKHRPPQAWYEEQMDET